MAQWYVRRGQNVIGPVDISKLREAVAAGTLLPTDQLAKDAAGPWTAAGRTTLFAKKTAEPPRLEPAGRQLVPEVQRPLAQDRPPDVDDNKIAVVVRTTKVFIATLGRSALAAGGGVARFLSTRAQQRRELKLAKMQQRHELEMAKIQAQAAADSRRPQAPGGPTAFAPQVTQNTVVKVVQEGGGCGCSGCAWIILLIVLGVLGAILYLGSMTR